MRSVTRILIVILFIAFVVGTFAASTSGLGVSGIQNQETMSQIKKNCPDYYQNRNGDCLRRTYRSYFLIRSTRGGGPGFGK